MENRTLNNSNLQIFNFEYFESKFKNFLDTLKNIDEDSLISELCFIAMRINRYTTFSEITLKANTEVYKYSTCELVEGEVIVDSSSTFIESKELLTSDNNIESSIETQDTNSDIDMSDYEDLLSMFSQSVSLDDLLKQQGVSIPTESDNSSIDIDEFEDEAYEDIDFIDNSKILGSNTEIGVESNEENIDDGVDFSFLESNSDEDIENLDKIKEDAEIDFSYLSEDNTKDLNANNSTLDSTTSVDFSFLSEEADTDNTEDNIDEYEDFNSTDSENEYDSYDEETDDEYEETDDIDFSYLSEPDKSEPSNSESPQAIETQSSSDEVDFSFLSEENDDVEEDTGEEDEEVYIKQEDNEDNTYDGNEDIETNEVTDEEDTEEIDFSYLSKNEEGVQENEAVNEQVQDNNTIEVLEDSQNLFDENYYRDINTSSERLNNTEAINTPSEHVTNTELSSENGEGKNNISYKKEVKEESNVPKTLTEFLRKYPKSEMSFVLQYFSKKEIQKSLLKGEIMKRGNKLIL